MGLKDLKQSCYKLTNPNRLEGNDTTIPAVEDVDLSFWQDKPLFCPYQIQWVLDESPVAIIEKSRQIGFSWSMAFRAVLKAVSNQKDTIATSYNKESIKQYIRDCTFWAKCFNAIFQIVAYEDILNKQNVNIFEIKFNNGRVITGLPGDSKNLRSYSGRDLLIDEASYREENLEDILAAASATLIHGGTIRIGSTHAGTESDFNLLILKVKAGELPYKLFRTPFKEAVRQGLFERICAKQKVEWNLELQNQWVDKIYQLYGIRATEELDAIPSDFGLEGKIFSTFQTAKPTVKYWEHLYFRYTDLAASTEITAFCTASVKVQYDLSTKKLIIVDWYAEHLSPLDGDRKIINTAVKDGKDCYQIIEVEPGSSGIKYVEILKQELIKNGIFMVNGYRPILSKLERYIPAGNAAQNGVICILENAPWKDELERILRKINKDPRPIINDLGDCVSGLYDYIMSGWNSMLGS